jgi:hypothetical protein
MTLEQQVANLVSATTELTDVVNGELGLVRSENTTFKTSTLASLETIVTTKVRSSGFTVYVNPSSGSSNPTNPIDNISAPFNTIANAVAFLSNYYWAGDYTTIKLSAGDHIVSGTINIKHSCDIKIEGASAPDFSGVASIVSQTTSSNRSSSSSTTGSNANLFNHLQSIFQSSIVIADGGSIILDNTNFCLFYCLVYAQNKTSLNKDGIALFRGARCVIRDSAFMYFNNAISAYTNHLLLDGIVLLSASNQGLLNYGSVINTSTGSVVYLSGNVSYGLYSVMGSIYSLASIRSYGNSGHGLYLYAGNLISSIALIAVSNGGCGFYSVYGEITAPNCVSQNNSQYGYRSDGGLIKVVGSDAATTGNILGKKLENNNQQGFVVGVSV